MRAQQRVLRFQVDVDDVWHRLNIPGEIVHVDSRFENVVELWSLDAGQPPIERVFRVYGTGQPIPSQGDLWSAYIATTVTPSGTFVWHLFEQHAS